jgi:hypothetical protein
VQAGVELLSSPADGIDVQAGDLCEQGVAAVTDLLGLQGCQPATLLLIEAAHQEVDLGVPVAVGVIQAGLAVGALALVNRGVRHDKTSAAMDLKARGSLYGKSWT